MAWAVCLHNINDGITLLNMSLIFLQSLKNAKGSNLLGSTSLLKFSLVATAQSLSIFWFDDLWTAVWVDIAPSLDLDSYSSTYFIGRFVQYFLGKKSVVPWHPQPAAILPTPQKNIFI